MSCLGRHRAGDGSYRLLDINRIPCKRVCDRCRAEADPTGRLEREGDRELAIQRAIDWAMAHHPWAVA